MSLKIASNYLMGNRNAIEETKIEQEYSPQIVDKPPEIVQQQNNEQENVTIKSKTNSDSPNFSESANYQSLNNKSNQSSLNEIIHLPYSEVNENQLMIIASYAQDEYQRFEKLVPEAGKALMKMIYAARDDGIWLVPVSGYRSIDKQKKLFENQVKKLGSKTEAKKISAPPGFSEHHTGYTIDLTDGRFPKQDITEEFANTEAYQWLRKNAKKFDFELSFPRNNRQGLSFEPWHWRYVGSESAKKIFSKAINLDMSE